MISTKKKLLLANITEEEWLMVETIMQESCSCCGRRLLNDNRSSDTKLS